MDFLLPIKNSNYLIAIKTKDFFEILQTKHYRGLQQRNPGTQSLVAYVANEMNALAKKDMPLDVRLALTINAGELEYAIDAVPVLGGFYTPGWKPCPTANLL